MVIFNIKYVVILLLVLNLIIALCFNNRVSMDKFNAQQEYYKLVDIGKIKEIRDINIPVSYPVYEPQEEIDISRY